MSSTTRQEACDNGNTAALSAPAPGGNPNPPSLCCRPSVLATYALIVCRTILFFALSKLFEPSRWAALEVSHVKARHLNPCLSLIPCIVLSFMSAFGAPKSPTSTSFSGPQNNSAQQEVTTSNSSQHVAAPSKDSPTPLRTRGERSSSIRPMSMVQTYQPPTMEIAQDTIPELQPIFTFLNSHANKLYQEGYFLKLSDLDTRTLTSVSYDSMMLILA